MNFFSDISSLDTLIIELTLKNGITQAQFAIIKPGIVSAMAKILGVAESRIVASLTNQIIFVRQNVLFQTIEVIVTAEDTATLQEFQTITSADEFVQTLNTEIRNNDDLDIITVGTSCVNSTICTNDGTIIC